MEVGRFIDRSIARVGDRVNIFRSTPFATVIADRPIVAIDLGSRGGFERDLLPIAWAVDAFGFEPDPAEFARLSAVRDRGPWRSVRHAPVAISGSGGRRKLHIPFSPISASLLEHDESIGEAFGYQGMFSVERTIDVDTMTLDDAFERYRIPAPDYVKLDIEGAELEVLSSASRALEAVLVIKTEVGFFPMRRQQPLATDVDLFLRQRGFQLVDFIAATHWRRASRVAHPQLSRNGIPYSRGELAQGDFLYFRRPDTLSSADLERSLRASAIAMALGFFDYAATLLTRPPVAAYLQDRYGIDTTESLRMASRAFGRRVWAESFAVHLRRVVTFLKSAGALAG